jgi:predicted ATP-grasp superfamily ATP-dependent carboligase
LSASQPTVLLTSGRLPVSLELARALHANGCRVVVADPWPSHLCAYSRAVAVSRRVPSPQRHEIAYLDAIRSIADAESADLIVPVSEETPWVAGIDDPRVFCTTRARVLALHDKLSFATLASEAGLGVPATARADRGSGIVEHDFILKPRFSCSGRGVRRLVGGADYAAGTGDLVQAFIDGRTVSVFAIARGGVTLARVAYSASLLDGSVAIAFEREEAEHACIGWADAFIDAVGHTGFIAFDFVVDAAGDAYAVECNPRATSGLHFLTPDAVAAAVSGSGIPQQTLRSEIRFCESWSCFTRLLGSFGKVDAFRSVQRTLSSHRDVSFAAADPWPCLLMPINSRRLLWRAATTGQRFASAAVSDIEWIDRDNDR